MKKADRLLYNEKYKKAQRLLGNVEFEHENTIMLCDSAHLYEETNTLEAFGKINIRKGDTLNLYGDFLKYNGNTKIAEIEKNVRVVKRDMTLTTQVLTYDLEKSVATYYGGGTIVNKDNTLTSKNGYYYASSNMLSFKNDVLLRNPKYTMNSDTLIYNTVSKTAYFLGPTTIRASNNIIYCENGWYDTNKDISRFSKNAYIITKEQKLKSDSLYYDRKLGYGKALRNVSILDSAQNLLISGDAAEHWEDDENSIVTGNALMTQYFDKDTLFLHGDTLQARNEKVLSKEEKEALKKTGKENPADQPKVMLAYHGVRFFKRDIQGKCDSLAFTYRDSTMHLFHEPVLWSSQNQLTAEKIEVVTGKKEIKLMRLLNTAFIVSQEDTLKFNQIRGKQMTGYFSDNDLRKILVEGNGQTIYYVKDKNDMLGANRADCSDLVILLKNNEIEGLTLLKKPEGTLFPMKEADPKELRLKDFKWLPELRPKSEKDLMRE